MPVVNPTITNKKIKTLTAAIKNKTISTVEEGRVLLQNTYGQALRSSTIRNTFTKVSGKRFQKRTRGRKPAVSLDSKYIVSVGPSRIKETTNNKRSAIKTARSLVSGGFSPDSINVFQKISF